MLEASAIFFKNLLVGLVATLSSCEDNLISYAGKQGFFQGGLILKARSTEDLLKDAHTPEHIVHYLKLSQEILNFAQKKLQMKTDKSYQKLVVLERDWVTQLVVAAHKEKLEPMFFEFPIVGKVPYKGFFEKADADREAQKLRASGYDVYQRGAPAFSSLGWFADPLYTNMFHSEASLVELLFHELVHLNFYFKSNADFNEAFATWFSSKVSPEFIKASQLIQDKAAEFTRLQDMFNGDKAYFTFVKEAKDIAEKGYANGTPRHQIFEEISKLAKGTKALSKNLKTIEWNNAVLLSLSTYYEHIDSLENYARKHTLTPVEMLQKCIQRGPSIMPEMLHAEI